MNLSRNLFTKRWYLNSNEFYHVIQCAEKCRNRTIKSMLNQVLYVLQNIFIAVSQYKSSTPRLSFLTTGMTCVYSFNY